MKAIESSGGNTDWSKDILKDLEFIKAKKRYPIDKKRFTPTTVIAIVFVIAARMALPFFFSVTTHSSFIEAAVSIFIAVMFVVLVLQLFRTIKFDVIPTPYFLQENRTVINKFLSENHLAFSQHKEAPEVFIIISKNLNLSANPNKEYREIMVFIADDKQILVNSHFSGNKFRISPPSQNYKRMANELRKWLNEHINTINDSTLPVKAN
ncbi:MAG: hypothetical protein KDC11_05720 [Chitinophagaceae bacterium]|nr:hypothetical protein [Chitinophagaceae bacterium]